MGLRAALPWVPEVSRGPLRDLRAEGRPTNGEARVTIETLTETGNRAIHTSGTQGGAARNLRKPSVKIYQGPKRVEGSRAPA